MNRLPAPLALLLLAGCASNAGEYPSLAPRPIEGRALFTEPGRTATAAIRDPALDAKAAAAIAALDAGERDFATALTAAQGAIAGRPAPGSDAWVGAQQALTVLDAARQATTATLADLDVARLAAAQGLKPADTTALDAAYARAAALADRQRAAYDAEAARLPGG